MKNTPHGCNWDVSSVLYPEFTGVSDLSQHHTPHSGGPAGVDQIPTYVPIATLNQSH